MRRNQIYRLVPVKLHNFTAEFSGENTSIHLSEEMSEFCDIRVDGKETT